MYLDLRFEHPFSCWGSPQHETTRAYSTDDLGAGDVRIAEQPWAMMWTAERPFQVARDDLGKQMGAKTIFKPQGSLNLDSAIDTPGETTGDHDGRALLLVAQE